MSDAPIEPQDFIHGVKVVDIGDLRIARGMTRRPVSTCHHRHVVYDDKERRVWCSDCEQEVEPFDAFRNLVEVWHAAGKRLNADIEEAREAKTFVARSRAVKALDAIWRTKDQAPCCPHCKEGLLPEDMLGRLPRVSRELTKAKRKKQEGK